MQHYLTRSKRGEIILYEAKLCVTVFRFTIEFFTLVLNVYVKLNLSESGTYSCERGSTTCLRPSFRTCLYQRCAPLPEAEMMNGQGSGSESFTNSCAVDQLTLPGLRGGQGRKREGRTYAKPRLDGALRPTRWDCSMDAYQRSMRNAALDRVPRTPHAIWLAATTRTGALRASARRLDLMGRVMRWSFHRYMTRTWWDTPAPLTLNSTWTLELGIVTAGCWLCV